VVGVSNERFNEYNEETTVKKEIRVKQKVKGYKNKTFTVKI